MTRRAIVLLTLLILVPFGVPPAVAEPAPAVQAAETCMGKTFTGKIKFDKKVRVTVKHTASGCIETDGECTFGAFVVSANFKDSAKVTRQRGAKTEEKYAPYGSGGKTFQDCGGTTKLLTTDFEYEGVYSLRVGRKRYIAAPRLLITVSGDEKPALKFEKVGLWKFVKVG